MRSFFFGKRTLNVYKCVHVYNLKSESFCKCTPPEKKTFSCRLVTSAPYTQSKYGFGFRYKKKNIFHLSANITQNKFGQFLHSMEVYTYMPLIHT